MYYEFSYLHTFTFTSVTLQMRTEHLSLMLMIVRQSDYSTHRYRINELTTALNSIKSTTSPTSATFECEEDKAELLHFDCELTEMIHHELH